jgi:hypothetical protein
MKPIILGKAIKIRPLKATRTNIHILAHRSIRPPIAHIGKNRNLVSPLKSGAVTKHNRQSNESPLWLRAG